MVDQNEYNPLFEFALSAVGADASCEDCDWLDHSRAAGGRAGQHAQVLGHTLRVTLTYDLGPARPADPNGDGLVIVARAGEAEVVSRLFGTPEARAALAALIDSRIGAEGDDG